MGSLSNIAQFRRATQITKNGGYDKDGHLIEFAFSKDDLECVWFYSAEETTAAANQLDQRERTFQNCSIEVTNEDSFTGALRLAAIPREQPSSEKMPPIVLNFANPSTPGGSVKLGASAQEEDLCRASTLYASLASSKARPFYEANRAADKVFFSDGLLISPNVEIFADNQGRLLDKPVHVAVMTCPAPYAKGARRSDRDKIEPAAAQRIAGMLGIAALCGYSRLVLGAWGCGVFGNSSEAIAGAFASALAKCGVNVPGYPRAQSGSAFSHVTFAILGKTNPGSSFDTFRLKLGNDAQPR